MSGSGRPRTSSFAEPPGVSGTAAASAGSAAAVGSSTGKSGVTQASGSSSSGCSNLKLASKLHSTLSEKLFCSFTIKLYVSVISQPRRKLCSCLLPNQLASVLISVHVKASYCLFCMLQSPNECICLYLQ